MKLTQADPSLYNPDLRPIPPEERTWGTYNYASLWVAMSVCIPTYMLASGLIAGGMSWLQAILTILLGNLIVLIPMLLNAHAGTRYGIPFPVFVRASFGVRGANVPALLRALVACGWFGIQAWIGGQAIYAMLLVIWPGAATLPGSMWICFFLFWAINMLVIWYGIETIKLLQGIGAPFMLAVGLLLLFWITRKAGGLGPVLRIPSKFHSSTDFMRFFIPSLTGMVGFWATVALNIPDFTRYAKSQRAQIVGQDHAEKQLAQNQVEPPLQKQRLSNLDVVKAKDSVAPQAESSVGPAAAIPNLSLQNGLRAFPRWAITSSGTLQRSFDAGRTWEDVSPSQTESGAELKPEYGDKKIRKKEQLNPAVVFRAVAALGSEIWAGGSSAMLYHSFDSGSHWIRVMPIEANASLTGDIVSMDFSDPQHGEIATSAGELWMTSDDGQTWHKQQ